MNATRFSQTFEPARLVNAGALVFALVLSSATAAWSETPDKLQGPGAPLNKPGQQPQLTPGRISPYAPKGMELGPSSRFLSQSPQTQIMDPVPPIGNYSFVNINIPNSTNIQPSGVNNSGLVVGWYQDANGTHGFLWKGGTLQTIDYPGASATILNGLNNHGLLIGYYVDAKSAFHGVIYSVHNGAWTVLPDIAGHPYIYPNGINDEGVAVGYAQGGLPFSIFDGWGGTTLAWMWHPDSSSYSFFTAAGAAEAGTYPYGINGKRQTTGYLSIWRSPFDGIGFLKGGCTEEGDSEDTSHNCADTSFTVPGALAIYTFGINNRGTIVGSFFNDVVGYGFVRTLSGAFTSVNVPGSLFTDVYGINDHGSICGNYYTNSYTGFVAYPK